MLPLVGLIHAAQDAAMFSVHCPAHGSRVLLSERAIEGIDRIETGLNVRWRCHCGERGVLRTGRPRPPARLV
jgi:hypothetical protein